MTFFTLLLVLFGCTEKKIVEVTNETPPEEIVTTTETEAEGGSGELVFRCSYASLGDELRSPKTIAEAVNLINALPKPLELSCFLRSLKRPLFLNLTDSAISIQPANGRNSPRVFIFSEDLIMSVVTEGNGENTLEFGQLSTGNNSIKGELNFPILADITQDTPYATMWPAGSQLSRCVSCHGPDTVDDATNGYESIAIRPSNNRKVELYEFDEQRYLCQMNDDNDGRCRIIRAIMAYGEVRDIDFPQGLPTFFEAQSIINSNR
jgi:cytochrome c553